MRRIIVHNHLTRNIGRFRATAGAHDRKDCGCGCGGRGDCQAHDLASAELGIDVTYKKGDKIESRHYTVPQVTVDPHGRPPSGSFVAIQLRKNPDYNRMLNAGWEVEKADGYYKREQRDVGRMV